METKWKLFDKANCPDNGVDHIVTVVGFKEFHCEEYIEIQYLDGDLAGAYGLALEEELFPIS